MTEEQAPHDLIRMLVVGVTYYAGAWLGVHGTVTAEGIAILWPPNAVLLAAFLLSPRRQWPLLVPPVMLAELFADVPTFPVWAALAFAAVNLFEASLAAALIRRCAGDRFGFDSLSGGACFLLFGPLLAASLAGLLGATVYLLLGRADTGYLALWRLWWFGDALGLLVLTPLIATLWRRFERGRPPLPEPLRALEAAVLGLSVLGLGLLVFVADRPGALHFYFSPILLVPMGMWAAIRFGVTGATLTVALIASLAVGHLVHGIHPYPNVSPGAAVWLTQEYLAIVALVSVGLALLLHEIEAQRRALSRHERVLAEQNVVLERRIAERTAELRAANARLSVLATTDHLTALDNRRHFEERAQRELMRLSRGGAPASLLMLDLDYFKEVNDRFGHDVGDEVLRQFAQQLRRSVRPSDVCARSGGEEFVVLLPETEIARARKVSERILRDTAALRIDSQGRRIRITTSIGLAEWDGKEKLDTLMYRADQALYRAKSGGRNRLEIAPRQDCVA